jgi:hypothetical protein
MSVIKLASSREHVATRACNTCPHAPAGEIVIYSRCQARASTSTWSGRRLQRLRSRRKISRVRLDACSPEARGDTRRIETYP